MAEITNPHAKPFRAALGQADIAADFVTNYLPQAVVACLDLATLAPQPDDVGRTVA